jgi:hypothetical protein
MNTTYMPDIHWSPACHPEWDTTPEAYVKSGAVGWGRSRRLGKLVDDALHLKAYLGVQHEDPTRWGLAGEPRTRFFLSLFLHGRTVSLRTYPTMPDALIALTAYHNQLVASRTEA